MNAEKDWIIAIPGQSVSTLLAVFGACVGVALWEMESPAAPGQESLEFGHDQVYMTFVYNYKLLL